MNLIKILIIGISLSMDAFSLSLAYGTLNIIKKDITKISIVVGIYHFIMPILGNIVGNKIIAILPIKANIIVFLILFILGLNMILETFKNNRNIKPMKFKDIILFGLAVSIDSFSLGIGLNKIYNNILISSIIISSCSFVFTYLGLSLGKIINEIVGKISTLIGGIILAIMALFYIV